MKKNVNEKRTRVIGLVLGLVLSLIFFLLLFFFDHYSFINLLEFEINYTMSIVHDIAWDNFSQKNSHVYWLAAIPIYWFLACFLIWRFRTFLGCGLNMFFKKI